MKRMWERIINAGTESMKPYDTRLGVVRGINFLSLWTFMINITFGPFYALITWKGSILIGSLCEAALVAGLIGLNYKKKYTIAKVVFYLVLNLATLYFSFILGQSVEAQLMVVLLVGLCFFMFMTFKARAICITTTILLLILMEANFKMKFVQTEEKTELITSLMRWTAYAVIIFLVGMLFYLYAVNNRILLEQLTKYSQKIESNLETEVSVSNKKSRFIRHAYHELKNQFWGLNAVIQVLASKKDNGSNYDKMLSDLKNGSQNIQMIISNILEYSKFEAGIISKPLYEPVNFKNLVSNLVNLYQYSGDEKGIKIDFCISSNVPEYIILDKVKVVQIVNNLINNAIKFTKPNSDIFINIEGKDDCWRITVKDQGNGISPDKLNFIFEPFITERGTHNSEGIGLGLHITKQLVLSLGGNIQVSSIVDKGTTFVVCLPAKELLTHSKLKDAYRETCM